MGNSSSRDTEPKDDDNYQYTPPTRRRGPEQSQKKQISSKQVKNALGGWVFEVDDMQRARRFLFMGSEGVTYTASYQLKRENAKCFDRLISAGRGKDTVTLIRQISIEGRAAKQRTTLFALAICAKSNDEETKKAAYDCLNEVCRIPTHLFMFVKFAEGESNGTGFGRAHKRAISKWYEELAEKDPLELANLITKYKKRESWSHKDLFLLSHMKPKNNCLKVITKFVFKGIEEAKKLQGELKNDDEKMQEMLAFLEGTEKARKCKDETTMIQLIKQYSLVREHVPTRLLNSKAVWEALLKRMPMTAMIRNLGKMTFMGIIDTGSENENEIVERLNDVEKLKKARLHPFNVLVALNQYKKGHGDKGKLKWTPNEKVLSGLDSAFYLSFKAVQPTGKRYMLAIDVSESMSVPCMGTESLTCRDAASAMMMVTLRTEEHCQVFAFSHELHPVPVTKEDRLDEVIDKLSKTPFGGTDCALPMLYAMEKKMKVDVFIVYTDNETWYGKVHPFKAIYDYRTKSKIYNAKLIVVGMSSNGFTIADPDDPYMLDIVGFDSGAIEIMNKFILDEA